MPSALGLRHPLIGAIQPLDELLTSGFERLWVLGLSADDFERWAAYVERGLTGRVQFFRVFDENPECLCVRGWMSLRSWLALPLADFSLRVYLTIEDAQIAPGFWRELARDFGIDLSEDDILAEQIRALVALIAALLKVAKEWACARPLSHVQAAGGQTRLFAPLN